MWDTKQIGISGIMPDGRLDRRTTTSRFFASKLGLNGADATIGFPLPD
jgi:hypothetical protein